MPFAKSIALLGRTVTFRCLLLSSFNLWLSLALSLLARLFLNFLTKILVINLLPLSVGFAFGDFLIEILISFSLDGLFVVVFRNDLGAIFLSLIVRNVYVVIT